MKKESEVRLQFEEALLKQKECEDKIRDAKETSKKAQSPKTGVVPPPPPSIILISCFIHPSIL